ncbi:MAG: pyruvate dehydrogenase complex dihydrolipoamide acetyltransferase [Deltaproteobacteria bacterium]|nr:pyruvate dehydrogenase complex dihydrolipoamide acetyltransferase [Deltaproteobacteria bacterium]
MANLVTMPKLSPTMETGVISTWVKKVGDFVEAGEVLAEIETDKAVMEYQMADEGFLREILVPTGQEVPIDTPIAILSETKDEDIAALHTQAKAGAGPAKGTPAKAGAGPAKGTPAKAEAETPAPDHDIENIPVTAASTSGQAIVTARPMTSPAAQHMAPAAAGRTRISPYARKLAAEAGVNVPGLQGSGPGGRIVARDIQSAQAAGTGQTTLPGAPAFSGAAYEDLPLSMMRKAIARKMVESKTTVPHFQLTRKVRAEQLVAARESLNARFKDIKISLNDILIKASAAALRRHPGVNSQFLGDKIRRFNTVDIAVAVGTEEGLITPVVRNADLKGLHQISQEVRNLAQKAKDKKLAPEDYQGGTFSISNLGMFGVYEFNAIINTPQACILAVSGVVREPVVEGDHVVPGQTLSLTLSSDHRIVDGVTAAQFMETLTAMLENPLAMLV